MDSPSGKTTHDIHNHPQGKQLGSKVEIGLIINAGPPQNLDWIWNANLYMQIAMRWYININIKVTKKYKGIYKSSKTKDKIL